MSELTEEQKILILAKARKRKAEEEQAGTSLEGEQPGGIMPFINKSLAQFAGAPVDLTEMAMNKIASTVLPDKYGDTPAFQNSFGGTESIRRGLANVGIATPDREPETVMENIGAVGGEVAGLMLPLAKGAQLLSRGSRLPGVAAPVSQKVPTLRAIAGQMDEQLVKRPFQTAAIEAGAVAGAGIARDISKEQNYGPAASMTLELLGGLGGGIAATFPGARAVAGAGKRVLGNFAESGSFKRASARAQEVANNPTLAAQNIEDLKGSNLAPSAKSDDPGLMALEKTVAAENTNLGTQIAKKTSDVVEELVSKVAESGSIKQTKDFVAKKRERLNAALDARIEVAAENAKKTIDDLGDVASEADISKAQYDQLESALADAKVQEELLWKAVPVEAIATTSNVKSTYKDILKKLPKAQSDDIPTEARKLLGNEEVIQDVPSGVVGVDGEMIMIPDTLTARKGFGKTETIRELDGLYKRLGTVASEARKASNNNKSRIAERLREAILEDMKNITKGSQAAKESVETARAFSKELNQKFSEGSIGRILGTAKGVTSSSVNPELTLGLGVGQGGIKGNIAAREIATATGEDVTKLGAVQDFIKRRFLDAVTEDGVLNPTKARNWMSKNSELMENYPHLRDQFTSARSAEDASRTVRTTAEARRTRLNQPSVSATAKLLKAPVDEEIKAIFKSSDPATSMQSIVNTVAKDNSGEAMKGLRAGVAEYLINSITSPGRFDVMNRPVVMGSKLKNSLSKESTRSAMEKVFSKKEMQNWDKVADQLVLAQKQTTKGVTPPSYIINDRSSWLLRTAASIGGAKFGGKLASGSGVGGSLQGASIGSSTSKNIIDKLTADKAKQVLIDALTTDEELLKALLLKRNNIADAKTDKVLRAYMLNSGRRLLDDEEE